VDPWSCSKDAANGAGGSRLIASPQVLDDEMAVRSSRRLHVAMAQQALHAVGVYALT